MTAMDDAAIRVAGLGKLYRIGERESYKTLRDSITYAARSTGRAIASPFRHADSQTRSRRAPESVWALKDVSFDVRPGEVVGIIGRNGAGKSTLLKILSRITLPTEGRARIRGRVGSMLEVGTGFHPELTGRENVYLNGAILGMHRAEIDRKFEDIVAFAEIPKFMNTPVKRYSSGMFVRLAFAVAAHLEPDILLVDEVLAVGDAPFQRKCLGKMGAVAQEGRTVLFVSHNMAAITALCPRVIALKDGHVWADGSVDLIQSYWDSLAETARVDLAARVGPGSTKRIWFTGIAFTDQDGRAINTAFAGEDVTIRMEYESREPGTRSDFALSIYDRLGRKMLHCDTTYSYPRQGIDSLPQKGVVKCRIPKLPLVEGEYRLNILIHDESDYEDHIVGAAKLVVGKGDFYGTGKIPPTEYSPFLVDHTWEIEAYNVESSPRTTS